jgi:hypothetical protein
MNDDDDIQEYETPGWRKRQIGYDPDAIYEREMRNRTLEEVAKEFDLKEDTLKKQRYLSRLKEKKIGLPFVQFGPRTIKYNRLDIIKYIEEQKNK